MYVKKNLLLWVAVFTLTLPLMLVGTASARFANDGAVQDGVSGGWKAPADGICVLGIHADGTLDVDGTITNKRDCDAKLISGLTGTCDTVLSGDGAKHAKAGSSTCVTVDGSKIITGTISLKNLDRTAAICNAKGGFLANDAANVDQTQFATGKGCVAYGWQFKGQDANGTPLAFGAKGTAAGVAGFCYASVVTGITPTTDCPSNLSDVRAKYGYAVSGSDCTYAYGITGAIAKAATAVDGTIAPIGTSVDLSAKTMGECIAEGYSWNNWVPNDGTTATPSATIAVFDHNKRASGSDRDGCLHCHSTVNQQNGPVERWKDSYLKTGHKNMLRKVTAGKNWAGPNASGVLEVYTEHAEGTLNFTDATANVSEGANMPLLYIFGDWMAPAPAGLDVIVNNGGYGKYNGGSNYSCAACHTTGWSNSTAGLCSKSSLVTENTCTVAGYTWVPTTGLQGVVGQEPAASFPTITFTGAGNWDLDGIQCARCHGSATPSPVGTSGHQDSVWNAGSKIINLCYGCHQSPAKTNNGAGADIDTANPQNIPVKDTDAGAGYAPEFSGHVLGNSFLNSPHGKMSGVTLTPNKLGKWDLAGGTYVSTFKGKACFQGSTSTSPALTKADGSTIDTKEECEALYPNSWKPEVAAGSGSCTTCHDVHNSLFVTGQQHHPLRRECQTCHSDTVGNGYAADGVPQVGEMVINHPSSGIQGTPFDTNLYANSCEVCHMPKATDSGFPMHVWRISTDPDYSTFPTQAEFESGSLKIARSKLGTTNGKVYVDIDLACGQCHGGSKGAGATKNGAPYKTKAILAAIAKTMHVANTTAPVIGSDAYTYDPADLKGMTVILQDTSTGSGEVKINWGDGTISTGARGEAFTHKYTRAKTYTVAHSIYNGVQSDSEIIKITVPKTITISGNVTVAGGTNDGVTLILKYNGHTKKRVKSASDGSFTFSAVRPITTGEYTIKAYKYHVNFDAIPSLGSLNTSTSGVSITGAKW